MAQKGWAYARAGRTAEAMELIRTIERRVRDERVFYPDYDVASIHLAMGDQETALRFLGRAFEAGSEALLWSGVDPRMDALRTDPRFSELLRRAGLGD